MAILLEHLDLPRCPHCQIDRPNLTSLTPALSTLNQERTVGRDWMLFSCSRCGGAVLAGGRSNASVAPNEIYPRPAQVDDSLPPVAKEYLTQAVNSVHAPAGSVMLCASSIDAMLKAKGYDNPKQSLYNRIEKAADDHLITQGMKEWAHEIRLDANDQRHADQGATLPTAADAQRSIEFAQALGQFLFALPARVAQGRAQAQSASTGGNVSTPRTSTGIKQSDVERPLNSSGYKP